MANVGDSANQQVQEASQLSPLPKSSGNGCRARQDHGRGGLLRGEQERSLPPQLGRLAAIAAHDEPDSTRTIGRRRGDDLWPPSSTISSIERREINNSPLSFSNRGDSPQQASKVTRCGDYNGHGQQRQHQHLHQRGRAQPSPGSSVGSVCSSIYYGERSASSSIDRDRKWDWEKERDSSHHGSYGYKDRNNDDAKRRKTYGGGGNRSRSRSPLYYGFDVQGDRAAMDKRASNGDGGERHPRDMFKSGGADCSGDMKGNVGRKDHCWQNSVDAVYDEQSRGNGITTRKTLESQSRRPRSGCNTGTGVASGRGSKRGVDEPIMVDSDAWEKQQQTHFGVQQQQQQQHQERTSQQRSPALLMPPPPPHYIPPRQPSSAHYTGSLAKDASSRSRINSSTVRKSWMSPSPPPEEVSWQPVKERRNNTGAITTTTGTIRMSVAPVNMVVEALPVAREAVETMLRLEAVGQRQLGDAADVRREIAANENQQKAGLRCPHTSCRLHGESRMDPNSMSRHLAVHTRKATEEQITRSYVSCTVAEVLHELCMDVDVARSQRKFERRRMGRALFGTADQLLGFPAAVLETKVLENVGNTAIRRCASELAFGFCEGVGPPDQIVCCETCGAWTHIHCGGVSIGGTVDTMVGWSHTTHPNALPLADGVSQPPRPPAGEEAASEATMKAAATAAVMAISPAVPVLKEEHICCTCARLAAGPDGSDGSPGTVSTLMAERVYRKRLLGFLEREAVEGRPIGVFDLNLRVEELAAYPDLKRRPCSREGCGRESRFESCFCCDGCGVLDAESLLTDAVVYSLEEREGRERGKRLRVNRLTRKRQKRVKLMFHERGQITQAAQFISRPDVSALGICNEEQLQVIVKEKRRLWKRLIEIGAYWEKVCGSKITSTVRDSLATRLTSPAATRAVATCSQATAAAAAVEASVAMAAAPSLGTASDVGAVRAGVKRQQPQQRPLQHPQDSSDRTLGTGTEVLSVKNILAGRRTREAHDGCVTVSSALSSSQRMGAPPHTSVGFLERQPLHRAPPARQQDEGKDGENAEDIRKSGGAFANTAAATPTVTASGTATSAENPVGSRKSSDISDKAAVASVDVLAIKRGNGVGVATEECIATAAQGGGASVARSFSYVAIGQLASAGTDNSTTDNNGKNGNRSGSQSNNEAERGATDGAGVIDEPNTNMSTKDKNVTASNNTGASNSSSSSRSSTLPATTTGTGKRTLSDTTGETKNDEEIEVDVGVEQGANAASAETGVTAGGQQQTLFTTPTVAAPSNNAAAAPVKRLRTSPASAVAPRVSVPAASAATATATATATLARPATLAAPAVMQCVQARQWEGGSQAAQREVEVLFVRFDSANQRAGAEEQICPYCGSESGPDVAKHLEKCYQQVTAARNARLSCMTMRPPPFEASATAFQARRTSLGGVGLPPIASGEMTLTRQLLQRRVTYAKFAALPDSGIFRLHRDLQGWMSSPSRLDLLHKELVRQRNDTLLKLQMLDRDEALLELKLRRAWAHDGLGEAVSRIWRNIDETSNDSNNKSSSSSGSSNDPVILD